MAKLRSRMTLLGIHDQLTKFRFLEIESFIHHSREGMNAAWEEFSERFDKTTTGWDEAEVAEYVDYVYDDIAMLRDESPQLLRHAQCMIVYGTFEHAIVNLCRALHRDKKIATPPKPKNMYMDDVKGYLRPHLGKRPRPDPFSKDWQFHEFRIIRNWMAHNGGRVQKDSNSNGNWKQANTFVRRNRGLIRFTERGDITVEDELIRRALEKARDASDTLHKAARRLYR